MKGEVRIVDSVPEAYAALVAAEAARALSLSESGLFRLGCSGGSSGQKCYERLSQNEALEWSRLACYFVDERCVDPDSPDSNQRMLREVFGARVDQMAGFYPMSCDEGALAYEQLLRIAGPMHLCQLGLGPDGHTASLFPESKALSSPPGRLVVQNEDPLGNNVHPRLSLTFESIAQSELIVFTVIGADKADAMAAIDAGRDLPAARVDGPTVIWLCDPPATAKLGSR